MCLVCIPLLKSHDANQKMFMRREFRFGDKHSKCVVHRKCSRVKTCKFCTKYPYWDGVEAIRIAYASDIRKSSRILMTSPQNSYRNESSTHSRSSVNVNSSMISGTCTSVATGDVNDYISTQNNRSPAKSILSEDCQSSMRSPG